MSVIKVKNLTKIYKLYNNSFDRVKEALHPLRKKFYSDFFALKKVTFDVKKGETVGIIGKNGSGKSTLLKIITGVLSPTEGSVSVQGRVSALLELGAGFNPELTGLENIYFVEAVMGFTRKETEKKLDAIIDFADIGDFLYQPMKIYSSGMIVRLAFAATINIDPEILIIDEALAVGDVRFQQKCFRKFKEFQNLGKTILFVSHDTGAILNYCDRTLWLKDGEIHEMGKPEDVCRKYSIDMAYGTDVVDHKDGNAQTFKLKEVDFCGDDVTSCSSFGEGGARIKKAVLLSHLGEKIKVLEGGRLVKLSCEIEILQNIEYPIVGFIMKDSYGNAMLGMNSYVLEMNLSFFKKGERIMVEFTFDFPKLKNGFYSFSPAIAEGTQENHLQHHWVHDAYIVEVVNKDRAGLLGHYFIVENQNITLQRL